MIYKGRISISFEALKELLSLDNSVDITYVGMTEEDLLKDTCYIKLSSKEPTSLTQECSESSIIPKTLEIKELNKRS